MVGQDLCWKCGRKQKAEREAKMAQHNRGSRGGGGHGGNRQNKPYYLETFLTDDGFIRKEVFVDKPKIATGNFVFNKGKRNKKQMTQRQIRAAFRQLKSFSNRMRIDKKISLNEMKEVYLRFYRWAKYQEQRKVIPREFLDFVEYHTEVATKSKDEFNGFVEYITSILVELRAR